MIFRNFFEDFHAKISHVNREEHLLETSVWIPHYNGAWLAVCDTVTVVLGDIALLAFEKILDLFLGTEKLHFYNCTNFCLQLHKIFYNCTICAQLHTKEPWTRSASELWPKWRVHWFTYTFHAAFTTLAADDARGQTVWRFLLAVHHKLTLWRSICVCIALALSVCGEKQVANVTRRPSLVTSRLCSLWRPRVQLTVRSVGFSLIRERKLLIVRYDRRQRHALRVIIQRY